MDGDDAGTRLHAIPMGYRNENERTKDDGCQGQLFLGQDVTPSPFEMHSASDDTQGLPLAIEFMPREKPSNHTVMA